MMSTPQRCPGDLKEEWSRPKRVCLRVQYQDLTEELKAATLEGLSVHLESRDISTEDQLDPVGPSATSLGCVGVTKEAFTATGESSVVLLQAPEDTLGSSMTLQCKSAALRGNNATGRSPGACETVEGSDIQVVSNSRTDLHQLIVKNYYNVIF